MVLAAESTGSCEIRRCSPFYC